MITIGICLVFLLAGLLFQRWPGFPLERSVVWVNSYLFNLVLPSLALLYIPQIEPSWNLLLPISSAWVTFLLSWFVFGVMGKLLHWNSPTTGCMIIVTGLANTSFLGFPFIEILYGSDALPTALLIDQGGSFLLASSLAILVGSIYSDRNGRLRHIPKKIITFPPFLFLILTLFMSLAGWRTPEFLIPALSVVGKSMAPVALLAIGMKFSLDFQELRSRIYWLGIAYRLVLAPAVIWVIYRNFLPESDLVFKVTVLESGMAPMITGSIVAIQYGLNPRLATLLAGLGIPISILTVLMWYFLLG